MDELETLFVTLGMKTDDPSVDASVKEMIKTLQKKLNSSIYGGENGVITLPATIEGTFKNGKEIDKQIKDAYAAIYEKAKQMADESVSLTLDDIKSFKTQIDKFGKKTAKYKSSDIIANANNNLRQTLSGYQDFVNNLRTEASKIQKAEIKQAQKTKAQNKAKERKSSYHGITDEEINDAIAKENARQAKIKAKRDAEAAELAAKFGYKTSSGLDASRTDKYNMNASEFSEYESKWARELAKTIKELYKTTVDKQWIDKEYKPKTGAKSRATSREEYLNDLSTAARNDLVNLIAKSEKGKEEVTFDQIVEAIGVMRTIYEENGKDMATIAKAITDAVQGRYDDNPKRKNAGVNREEGTVKGVGPGHKQAQEHQRAIQQLLKGMLGEVKDLNKQEEQANKVTQTLVKNQYEEYKNKAKTSDASKDTQRIANEIKGEKARDERSYIQDVRESSAERIADTAEAQKNQQIIDVTTEDKSTGFNTNEKANELIGLTKQTNDTLKKVLDKILVPSINLPEKSIDLYKKLADTTKLALPKPDGRRKRISNGLKDENPPLSLIPIQKSIMKALDLPRTKFGKTLDITKTLTESIFTRRANSIEKSQRHIANYPEISQAKYESEQRQKAEELRTQREYDLAAQSNARKEIRRLMQQQRDRHTQNRVITFPQEGLLPRSEITTSLKDPAKWSIKLKDAFADLFGVTAKYKKIIAATSDEQDKLVAEQISRYGRQRGRDIVTSDKIMAARSMSLWRDVDGFKKLFGELKITDGIKIDTTEITDEINKVFASKQWRNAQMGGSPLRQLLGYGMGFIGMPSIEKSRAITDAFSQISANIREAMNTTLNTILEKESALAGMKERGELKLDDKGNVLEGSTPEAQMLVAELESAKITLDSILADVGMVDDAIKKSHGNVSKIMKQLGFTSSVLRENNTIVNNINAGYDKNGKALRFQTRTAEILNYTFRLMSRHIGQMIKNWALMINPINFIRRAISDFMGYDVKWQRTMNVIKHNIRTILRPFMEWLAQSLVNVIGFVDRISMKIQQVFGKIPVSLFDQAAAESEKIREQLEAAANVTAGFDELHDIGSDNSGAMDLMGEIYKPQLSEDWKKLADDIGEFLGKLFHGDMGFGEAMTRILELLGETLSTIATSIWNWFKQTAIGKYITEHWQEILAKVLGAFLAWKLLKIAGKSLFDALFGKLLEKGAISGVFSKIGGWISSAFSPVISKIAGLFTGSGFLAQLGAGFTSIFKGQGLIGLVKDGALTFGSALGSIIGGALIAVVGWMIGDGIHDAAREGMENNNMYDIGLMENGGKESDKKGRGVLNTIGTIGGSTIKWGAVGAGIGGIFGGPLGMLIGGGIGAAIGAVAGTIETILSPAVDAATISFKNMNNEMQKISYYEGKVQGAKTQVNELDELMKVLNDTLQAQTEKVYNEGTELGITKDRMNQLIQAVQNGTFTTDMLTGKEVALTDSLVQLSAQQTKNNEVTKKLTEAKKKLEKAELDLAIAQDVAAGNFELAEARIEYAMASELYTGIEAAKKLTQITKEATNEQRADILKNISPELAKNLNEYATTTENGLSDISKLYSEMSEGAQNALINIVGKDTQRKIEQDLNSIDNIVKSHQNFWQGVGDTIAEIFSAGHAQTRTYNGKDLAYQDIANEINKNPNAKYSYSEEILDELKRRGLIPKYALGTNYVPNDGLAYLHQGEAVVPKKYNQPYQQGMSAEERAYMQQMMNTMRSLDNTMKQGIPVNGEFRQRGSDLVAVVDKNKSRIGADLLSNVTYAR